MRRISITALAALALGVVPAAQHYQSDFPPEEFRARWNRVFDRIGDQAVAAVQGVPMTNGYQLPRQHNTFYYLSGIETPGSYIVLDGRTRQVTLYLPPRNAALEAAEGKVLSADDAELVKKLTGVDDVLSTATMTRKQLAGRRGGRPRRAVAARRRVHASRRSTPSSSRPRRTRRAAASFGPVIARSSTTRSTDGFRASSSSSRVSPAARPRSVTSIPSSTSFAASRARARSRSSAKPPSWPASA